MWTRKELKARGKKTFNLNYWKTVLVALIAAMILGSTSGAGASAGASGAASGTAGSAYSLKFDADSQGFEVHSEAVPGDMDEVPEIIQEFESQPNQQIGTAGVAMILLVVGIVVLTVIVLIFLISAFLLNPLEVGIRRFFIQNLHTAAEVKEIAFGYDHCYKNNVKVLFFRDIYIVLWSLLFIIPGIIKSYEYRMIPYLLAENPEMPKQEAFARSKELMRGQKWRTFVLDLSFIGWEILNIFTLGILGIFYVRPYREMTNAALYEALAYGNAQEESAVWTQS